MANDMTDDTNHPVTRRELKAELAAAIAPLATKAQLDLVVGAMVERIKDEVGRSERQSRDDFTARIASSEERLRGEIQASEKRMSRELAQHTGTILEAMQVRISSVDDQYKQLPDRVSVLEKAVFGGGSRSPTPPAAPRPRRRRP